MFKKLCRPMRKTLTKDDFCGGLANIFKQEVPFLLAKKQCGMELL